MKHVINLSLLLLLTISCAKEKAKEKPPEGVIVNADGTQTHRSFYNNKKVKNEVTYRDSLKNGLAKSYDKDGNLLLEISYVSNKRQGELRRFYIGGAVFQTTEFKDDVKHGKESKFRSDGSPISEARYEKDYPCTGLKEYLDNKDLRSKYPQIVIKEINRMKSTGEYIIEISMTGNVRKVKYYTGKLTRSGCLSDFNGSVLMDEARRVGLIQYRLFPGQFMMEEINIVAVAETLNGNSYVCQKNVNLSLKN